MQNKNPQSGIRNDNSKRLPVSYHQAITNVLTCTWSLLWQTPFYMQRAGQTGAPDPYYIGYENVMKL